MNSKYFIFIKSNGSYGNRKNKRIRNNKEKKRALKLDLSDIRAKGMTNEAFIKQQLEYISLFSALTKVLNKESALKIMYSVMDATATEALLLSLPEIQKLQKKLVVMK